MKIYMSVENFVRTTLINTAIVCCFFALTRSSFFFAIMWVITLIAIVLDSRFLMYHCQAQNFISNVLISTSVVCVFLVGRKTDVLFISIFLVTIVFSVLNSSSMQCSPTIKDYTSVFLTILAVYWSFLMVIRSELIFAGLATISIIAAVLSDREQLIEKHYFRNTFVGNVLMITSMIWLYIAITNSNLLFWILAIVAVISTVLNCRYRLIKWKVVEKNFLIKYLFVLIIWCVFSVFRTKLLWYLLIIITSLQQFQSMNIFL